MADDPSGGGAPLSASIGEQLREKTHLDDERAAARQGAEVQQARVERHKEDEREAVARHVEAPVPRTLSARVAAPLADAWGARPWAVALGAFAAGALLAIVLPRR